MGPGKKLSLFLLICLPVVFMFAFFVIPLVIVVVDSFRNGAQGWGWQSYVKLYTEPLYLRSLRSTLGTAVMVTLVTLVPGFLIAYYIAFVAKSRWVRRTIYIIVVLPLFTSNVVRAFGFMVLLGRNGIVNKFLLWSGLVAQPVKILYTETAVVIGLTYIFVPFMVLAIASALQNVDKSLVSASGDLGASAWATFRHVILPLGMPGVLAGTIIVFTLSVSAYVTPSIMMGGRDQAMPSLIYEQYMSFLNFPFGAALAITLMLATLAMIVCYSYVFERKIAWSRA